MSKLIAFENNSGLTSLNLETGEAIVFSQTPSSASPAWNPAGHKLVLGKNSIYILDITSGNIDELLTEPNQAAIFPAWHPTLPIVAFSIRTDKGWMVRLHHLEKNDQWLLPLEVQAFQVDWHPDGNQIAFVGITPQGKQIFMADIGPYLDGKNLDTIKSQQLTQTGAYNHAPAWSPSGKQIAFEAKDPELQKWGIVIMGKDGSNQKRLSPTDVDDHHPSWSPNGKYLAVERQGSPNNIFILSADGKESFQMTTSGGREPAWFWPDKRTE